MSGQENHCEGTNSNGSSYIIRSIEDVEARRAECGISPPNDSAYMEDVNREIKYINSNPNKTPSFEEQIFHLKDKYIFTLKQKLILEKSIYDLPEEISYLRHVNKRLRLGVEVGKLGCDVSVNDGIEPESIRVNNNAFINLQLEVVSDQIDVIIESLGGNQEETVRYLEAKCKETLGRILDLSQKANSLRVKRRYLRYDRGTSTKELELVGLTRVSGGTLAICSS